MVRNKSPIIQFRVALEAFTVLYLRKFYTTCCISVILSPFNRIRPKVNMSSTALRKNPKQTHLAPSAVLRPSHTLLQHHLSRCSWIRQNPANDIRIRNTSHKDVLSGKSMEQSECVLWESQCLVLWSHDVDKKNDIQQFVLQYAFQYYHIARSKLLFSGRKNGYDKGCGTI